MRIVCDDKIPYLKGVFEPFASVEYLPGGAISSTDVKDADALVVRTRTKCNAELLNGSKIRFIASATIGYDHIDVPWCQNSGIGWANAPGCNSASVAQYIMSVLSYWRLNDYIRSFAGLTVGIIGCGNVGSKVLTLATKLGVKVLVYDPFLSQIGGEGRLCSLDDLLQGSDIITLHVPLTKGGDFPTYRLVNNQFCSKLKKGALLINSSRGDVLSEMAVLEALDKGILSQVALDVWENEPNINQEMLDKACISTPHIAGYSADGKMNGTIQSVRAVAHALNIEPLKSWNGVELSKTDNGLIFESELVDGEADIERSICKAILHTYNVKNDSDALKIDPAKFEQLRENYPLRREFKAFIPIFTSPHSFLEDMLINFGFTSN